MHEEGAAVFIMENDSNTLSINKDQFKRLQRENEDLTRRLGEFVERFQEEKIERMQKLRAMLPMKSTHYGRYSSISPTGPQSKLRIENEDLNSCRVSESVERFDEEKCEQIPKTKVILLKHSTCSSISPTALQFRKLQIENDDLSRRLSESMKRVLEEKDERMHKLKARQSEIESEVTEQHKQADVKQTIAGTERGSLEANKEETERVSLQKKLDTAIKLFTAEKVLLMENERKIEMLQAGLEKRDETIKELHDKLVQVKTEHKQEIEIETLIQKVESARKEKQMEEEFAKIKEQALAAKETEVKEKFEAKLHGSEQKIAELGEKVAKLEADRQESEEQKNVQEKELSENKLEIETLKLQMLSQIDEGQKQIAMSDTMHTKQIDTLRDSMEAELQWKEKKIQELEQLQMYEEAEKMKQVEQLETTVEQLKAQMETERQMHSNAVADLEEKQISFKSVHSSNAAMAEKPCRQKVGQSHLYETTKYKELHQQLRDEKDFLAAADAETTLLRGRLKTSEKKCWRLEAENKELEDQYVCKNGCLQQSYRQLQEAHELLQKQFHQPKAEADMNRQKYMEPSLQTGETKMSIVQVG